jgi:hypothetical protein
MQGVGLFMSIGAKSKSPYGEITPSKNASLLLCAGLSIEEDMGKKPDDN